jgi:ribosome biogenesis GTPase A
LLTLCEKFFGREQSVEGGGREPGIDGHLHNDRRISRHYAAWRYLGLPAARYDVDKEELKGAGVIEAIPKKLGCLLKGSSVDPDMEKAAMILLTDYRSSKLGRISLETPKLETPSTRE